MAASEADEAIMEVADPAFDTAARRRARKAHLCGIDEVGRGPLAGPVVCAAVCLDPKTPIAGLADSKLLTPEAREALFELIMASAEVAIAVAGPDRIERLNIRGATLWAMARAAHGLCPRPLYALIDGRDLPGGLPCPAEAVIGGDRLSPSIAAASIVAKVTRDRLMIALGRSFPLYGFERHKGYATADHRAALDRYGPTVHHRRSFAPVAACLAADTEAESSVPEMAVVPA